MQSAEDELVAFNITQEITMACEVTQNVVVETARNNVQ